MANVATQALLMLAIVIAGALNADARNYKGFVSGWSTPSDEADSDMSDTGGFYTLSEGKDSFGHVSQVSVGDLADWDGESFCDFDDTGSPRGVVLHYLTASVVQRRSNGDLTYFQLSTSPASTLCFNFIDNASSTFDVYTDVIGGTGKFKGATGTVRITGTAFGLGNITPLSAQQVGEINLVNGKRDRDRDDD